MSVACDCLVTCPTYPHPHYRKDLRRNPAKSGTEGLFRGSDFSWVIFYQSMDLIVLWGWGIILMRQVWETLSEAK